MYNTRSGGRIVLTGSARSHQMMRIIMPPTDLTPSQALDVLDSEEMIPDTEISLSGHVIASERKDNDDHDDDNEMVGAACKQLQLSSPRQDFRRDDDDDIPQNKIQMTQTKSQNLII